MLKYGLGFILCIIVMLPVVTWSGEDAPESKNAFVLDEIIASATKTDEKRSDVPNSVILISKEDIAESTALSLGDRLGNGTGIDLRTYGDFGGAAEEIHIRGMGADGTQVLVNGIVMNSPSLGSADISGIDLNSIEKVEVVKGSGSLLYGTGAMAGTVNIITKKPEKGLMDLKVSAGYGSHDTYDIAAEQGMFLNDNIGYYLTVNRKKTDGFRSNGYLDHKDVSLNTIYDSQTGLNISLFGNYSDKNYGDPGVRPPAGTADFIVNGVKLYNSESSNLLNSDGEKDMDLSLDINDKSLNWLSWDLKATYVNMESFNKFRFYSSFPVEGLPGSKTWVTNNVKGIEGTGDIDLLKGLNLLIGWQYKNYDWEKKNISLDGTGIEDISTKTVASSGLHTLGLFAEAQYRLNNYFKMIAGVRDENHSVFGDKYVQRYGMIINPCKDTAIKINYGEHFNAPTPNALFWPHQDFGFGSGMEGNRNLKPETGTHSDAGIEQSLFDNKLFLNVTYFMWDIKDKINWITDSSFFTTPQNMDKYKSRGLEIGSDLGPFYNLTLSIAYTYTDAQEKLSGGVNRQALYTADNYFKSVMKYADDTGFDASVTFRYTDDRPGYYMMNTDTKPSVTLASYSTIDLKIEKSFSEKWLLSLQANNISDKRYDTYTGTFFSQTFKMSTEEYPGAGRSYLLKASYKY
jgi:outer membrane cobalamin receptor